jgi:hypothetical protein
VSVTATFHTFRAFSKDWKACRRLSFEKILKMKPRLNHRKKVQKFRNKLQKYSKINQAPVGLSAVKS